MYAVIFEVEIKDKKQDEYLTIASKLKEQLVKMDGFISVERFESLVNEGKLVSLSFWENEKSIIAWKKNVDHLVAQKQGRESIFKDYRIRIAKVERDYTMKTSSFEK